MLLIDVHDLVEKFLSARVSEAFLVLNPMKLPELVLLRYLTNLVTFATGR